jgi:tetratricopeptide (TPR) repeat protein
MRNFLWAPMQFSIAALVLFLSPVIQAQPSVIVQTRDPAFDQALLLYNQKNFSAAKVQLLELTKKQPLKPLYWLNLGAANYMLKNLKSAEAAFRRTIELGGPLTNIAYWYLAKALRDEGSREQAIEILDSLLKTETLTQKLREQVQYDRSALVDKAQDSDLPEQALTMYRDGKYQESLKIIAQIQKPN